MELAIASNVDGIVLNSIIFISHKLEEIYKICQTITILRDGELIKTAPCSEIPQDKLINYIVGRETGNLFKKPKVELGEIMLDVRGLNR